ncbi:hypothetical protein K469DRAFT_694875 [Zopfia rhizophila CBS 207.26]|uniref:Uncharacterized protein n=1 Tax=Zopfia rhizophila CBS 207.26 TaxID=1314779 RepID=A0A6A6DL40_9PEZI|nr:hypothetical protein K469DRAFT_694875 [Zopfia rhizophila CBS 207.26]
MAATGILAAPSPDGSKHGIGYGDVKEYHGDNNHCGWGYKYYNGDGKCHIEHCPPGKAYWDKEKKCKDKPKCFFGHYWDEKECDCKKSHKCDKKTGTKWDDVKQECRKPDYYNGNHCGKGEKWDDEGKNCKKYATDCGPYMAWDGESKECVAWGRGFDYSD